MFNFNLNFLPMPLAASQIYSKPLELSGNSSRNSSSNVWLEQIRVTSSGGTIPPHSIVVVRCTLAGCCALRALEKWLAGQLWQVHMHYMGMKWTNVYFAGVVSIRDRNIYINAYTKGQTCFETRAVYECSWHRYFWGINCVLDRRATRMIVVWLMHIILLKVS